MDQTDDRPPSDDNSVKEAWRCSYCSKLMYNTDEKGRPVAGAPPSSYINSIYQTVCLLCFSLYHNAEFGSKYWRDLHEAWAKQQSNNDRLTGRTDYFTGA